MCHHVHNLTTTDVNNQCVQWSLQSTSLTKPVCLTDVTCAFLKINRGIHLKTLDLSLSNNHCIRPAWQIISTGIARIQPQESNTKNWSDFIVRNYLMLDSGRDYWICALKCSHHQHQSRFIGAANRMSQQLQTAAKEIKRVAKAN